MQDLKTQCSKQADETPAALSVVGGWPSSPGAVGNGVVLGSSFPSGHTLFVAAFGIAAALCISRIWPAAREFALSISILWLGDIGCIW